MKLECLKCHYKFEKDAVPPRCPYCAADGSVMKVKTAQDILNEVTQDISETDSSRKERGY